MIFYVKEYVKKHNYYLFNDNIHCSFDNIPHYKNVLAPRSFVSDCDTVIERFADYVKKNRVRILDFFRNQDRLNHGRILSDQFQNVLTLFGFKFTQEELDFLSKKYMTTESFTNYSNYRQFCGEVEAVAEGISRDIPQAPSQTQQIILKCRSVISKNRINILPTFQDFDKSGRGYVSKSQFGRVLATLGIPVSQAELPILMKNYESELGVDYFRFIEDVDEEHRQTRREIHENDMAELKRYYGKDFVTLDVADKLITEAKTALLPKLNQETTVQALIPAIQK